MGYKNLHEWIFISNNLHRHKEICRKTKKGLLELERAVLPILFHRILGNYRHLVNMMGLVDKVKNNCLLHILRPCDGLCDDLCDRLCDDLFIISSENVLLKVQNSRQFCTNLCLFLLHILRRRIVRRRNFLHHIR
jgi:hypothetical protein